MSVQTSEVCFFRCFSSFFAHCLYSRRNKILLNGPCHTPTYAHRVHHTPIIVFGPHLRTESH